MQQAQAQQAAMQQQAQGQPQAGGSQAQPGNNTDQRRLMDGAPQQRTQAATGQAQAALMQG